MMLLGQPWTILFIATAITLSCATPSPCQYEAQPVVQQAAGQQFDRSRALKWFARYDQIRREAQMSPQERQQADQLLSRGMSIIAPGPEKIAARDLLSRLVVRYDRARTQMKQLPLIPETNRLHRGYYQYFSSAYDLFSSYLTVQDNLFAKDPTTGRPLLGQLMERKQRLESLNNFIQDLDRQTRDQFNIPAYKYSTRG